MPSIADRLAALRRQRFVGRQAELNLFQDHINGPEFPVAVWHIVGPGGIGKTTLLLQLAQVARTAGLSTCLIDGRNIPATPAGFLEALRQQFAGAADPLQFLRSHDERIVLFIDTFEQLRPLDGWLREQFLPECPATMLTVVAGRQPPTLPWRTDTGWQALLHQVNLRNFSPAESAHYLTQNSLPDGRIKAIQAMTHGFPLALSLVVAQHQLEPENFAPVYSPDIIQALLAQILDQALPQTQREALEVLAMLRSTSEAALLALTGSEAPALFAWLQQLSFIETGPYGIFPHELARDTLLAELRWRDPARYAVLHRAAQAFYLQQLAEQTSGSQQRLLYDLIFLHRDNPLLAPFFAWQAGADLVPELATPSDQPAIIQLTSRHEGAASAQLAAHWLGHAESNVTLLRDGTGRLQGFLLGLWLEQLDETMLAADPVVAQVWTTMQRRNPLRPGERALFFRFWMAAADYQAVGQVQSNIFLQMVQQSVLTPGLAYTLIPTAEPAFWELMGDSIDFHAWPEATFVVDQKQYGVFGHDWRALPPHAWLALLAEREIALTAADTQPPPAAPLLVLSEAEFATAVRQALRDYTRPEFLKTNPLLRSRLVYADLPQAGDPREQLRHILAATAALMQETPKLAPFYEPLRLTYLEPAGTQEQVAEQLDLPFGTYRRHLKSGLEYLTERLWQRELGQ